MPAPQEDLFWTLTKISGLVAGILGTLGTIVHSFLSRRSSDAQMLRQSLETRVMDLERKYDEKNEQYNRRVDELRSIADRQKIECDRRIDDILSSKDKLLTEIRTLTNESIDLRHKVIELENIISRLHSGG